MTGSRPPFVRGSSFLAVMAGAVVGGLAGCLFLTPAGRRICHATAQALDLFSVEWMRLSRSVGRAQTATVEGWAFERGDPPFEHSPLN